MDFKQLVKSVKNEASEAVEITKLRAKISKEKSDVKENYTKIGEQMYKNYKQCGVAPEEFMDTMGMIDEARENISKYNAEIEKIKAN